MSDVDRLGREIKAGDFFVRFKKYGNSYTSVVGGVIEYKGKLKYMVASSWGNRVDSTPVRNSSSCIVLVPREYVLPNMSDEQREILLSMMDA